MNSLKIQFTIPLTAQIIAKAIAVFPEEASITVWPGFKAPDFSASCLLSRGYPH